MDRTQAIQQIRDACRAVVPHFMKITPAAVKLADEETQAAVLKHAHQMTVELESIKKLLARLEKSDDSGLL